MDRVSLRSDTREIIEWRKCCFKEHSKSYSNALFKKLEAKIIHQTKASHDPLNPLYLRFTLTNIIVYVRKH